MIVPPGLSRPSFSAASIRRIATRSLIEPPGLKSSSLATICGVSPAPMRREPDQRRLPDRVEDGVADVGAGVRLARAHVAKGMPRAVDHAAAPWAATAPITAAPNASTMPAGCDEDGDERAEHDEGGHAADHPAQQVLESGGAVLGEREDGEDGGEDRQRREDPADVRAELGGRRRERGDEAGGGGHAQRELVAQGRRVRGLAHRLGQREERRRQRGGGDREARRRAELGAPQQARRPPAPRSQPASRLGAHAARRAAHPNTTTNTLSVSSPSSVELAARAANSARARARRSAARRTRSRGTR